MHVNHKTNVTAGLLVRLEAKPDRVGELRQLLRDGAALVMQEPATIAWFAVAIGPTTFGIFDAFPDAAGREAHVAGQLAAALFARAPDLLAQAPSVESVDVIAAKLA